MGHSYADDAVMAFYVRMAVRMVGHAQGCGDVVVRELVTIWMAASGYVLALLDGIEGGGRR